MEEVLLVNPLPCTCLSGFQLLPRQLVWQHEAEKVPAQVLPSRCVGTSATPAPFASTPLSPLGLAYPLRHHPGVLAEGWDQTHEGNQHAGLEPRVRERHWKTLRQQRTHFRAAPFPHSTDLDVLVDDIVASEQLISEKRKPQLRALFEKVRAAHPVLLRLSSRTGVSPSLALQLQSKQVQYDGEDFYLYKILRAHILPLTNCAFNKAGDKCVLPAVLMSVACQRAHDKTFYPKCLDDGKLF